MDKIKEFMNKEKALTPFERKKLYAEAKKKKNKPIDKKKR